MKLNTDKCYFSISGSKYQQIWADIVKGKTWESSYEKILGVTIDEKLNFDCHMPGICLKANQKLSVFVRLFWLLSFDRKRLLFNVFRISVQILFFGIYILK